MAPQPQSYGQQQQQQMSMGNSGYGAGSNMMQQEKSDSDAMSGYEQMMGNAEQVEQSSGYGNNMMAGNGKNNAYGGAGNKAMMTKPTGGSSYGNGQQSANSGYGQQKQQAKYEEPQVSI